MSTFFGAAANRALQPSANPNKAVLPVVDVFLPGFIHSLYNGTINTGLPFQPQQFNNCTINYMMPSAAMPPSGQSAATSVTAREEYSERHERRTEPGSTVEISEARYEAILTGQAQIDRKQDTILAKQDQFSERLTALGRSMRRSSIFREPPKVLKLSHKSLKEVAQMWVECRKHPEWFEQAAGRRVWIKDVYDLKQAELAKMGISNYKDFRRAVDNARKQFRGILSSGKPKSPRRKNPVNGKSKK